MSEGIPSRIAFAIHSKDAQLLSSLLVQYPEFASFRGLAGRTPLHMAATSDDEDLINTILKGGGDPVARDDEGQIPLAVAVLRNKNKASRTLILHTPMTVEVKTGLPPIYIGFWLAKMGRIDLLETVLGACSLTEKSLDGGSILSLSEKQGYEKLACLISQNDLSKVAIETHRIKEQKRL